MICLIHKLKKAWFILNRAFFITVLLFSFTNAQSQNFVPNGGFEEYKDKNVFTWIQPGGGYYHFEITPKKSYSGSCRNGLCLWIKQESEFLSVKLNKPLQKEVVYEVECYILYDASLHKFANIKHLEIGFYFTKEPVDATVKRILFAKPQVVFDANMLVTWTRYDSIFKAEGGEEYLTIGHFHSTDLPSTIKDSIISDTNDKDFDITAINETIDILQYKKEKEINEITSRYHENFPELNKYSDLAKIYDFKKREKEYNRLNSKFENILTKMNKEIRDVKDAYDDEIRDLYVKYTPKEISVQNSDWSRARFYFDDISVTETNAEFLEHNAIESDTASIMTEADTTDEFTNASAGSVIILNNVYFEVNKSDLLPESYAELDRLVELMEKNSGMIIEISGHTDNSGKAEKNISLSQARAKSVADYLNEKGDFTHRITYVGCGSSRPIGYNYSKEGKAKNRRVECKIIKK